MTRTLFLHRDLPFHGGVARSFLTYACYRDIDKIHMSVAAFKRPMAEMNHLLEQNGVKTYYIGDRGYLGPLLNLRKLLKRDHTDVVVCSSFKSYVAAKISALFLKCRVVFWVPSLYVFGVSSVKKTIYRLLARKDTLIFISNAVMRLHTYQAHAGKRKVIYHGVEDPLQILHLQPYSRDALKELAIPHDSIVLGYVAEFTDCKDHATLLRAFSELAEKYMDIHLLLIGTGDMLDDTRTMARSLASHERVHFLGAREDARRLFGIMDIYTHTCRGEGFGLAVVEAMLAGVPVVASDEGALPEFVHDGETGLLFSPGDSQDLMRKIELFLNDRDLREKVAENGRQYCLEKFPPTGFVLEMTSSLEDEAAMMQHC